MKSFEILVYQVIFDVYLPVGLDIKEGDTFYFSVIFIFEATKKLFSLGLWLASGFPSGFLHLSFSILGVVRGGLPSVLVTL